MIQKKNVVNQKDKIQTVKTRSLGSNQIEVYKKSIFCKLDDTN